MHELVKAAKTDPKFRELALELTAASGWKDYYRELENAFSRLRSIYVYRRDPHQVEWVQNPWYTLKDGGDCDDASVLISSVMGATGAGYRFVTIKADPKSDDWSHVFAEISVPGRGWVAADLSVKKPLGWRPQGFPEKLWPEPVY
jgi:transglutaminase-like putative cysteine protease